MWPKMINADKKDRNLNIEIFCIQMTSANCMPGKLINRFIA